MSFFTANERRATRSGWRKPAVVRRPRCDCVTPPRRAHARRSRLRVRLPASIVGFSSATVRATHHGGLTPAALANVRLCIEKGVIWPVTGHRAWRQERGASAPRGKHPLQRIGNAHRRRYVAHANESGGRKPPVAQIRRCESETHTAAGVSRMQPRAGGVSPPWSAVRIRARNAESHRMAVADAITEPRRAHARRSWLRIRQSPNITRLSPASVRIAKPRRANARRSCERAFVHRKNRFFAGKRSQRNTRAVSVS
jgi:hypothetical protein